MPNTAELSDYLKPDHVTDGDTVTFANAGEIKSKSFKEGDEPRKVLEIGVTFKGEKKTYSPNATSIKNLSAAWGTDTEKWVGKTAALYVVPSQGGKDMILAKPSKESGVPF